MTSEEAAGHLAPILKQAARDNTILVCCFTNVTTGQTFTLSNLTSDGAERAYLDQLVSDFVINKQEHMPYKRFDVD